METSNSSVMHLLEGSTHLVKCMAHLAHETKMGFAWIKQIGRRAPNTLWTVDIGYGDKTVKSIPPLQFVECE